MSSYSIHVVESRVVAGSPSPHDASRFFTFPSLTQCSDGSFLCAALVGSQKSGPDGRIKVFRSMNACQTWEAASSPTLWDEQADPNWGHVLCHMTETTPGRLLAAYVKSDRRNPDEPLFHPKTNGIPYSVVRLAESLDGGRTWSEPWDLDYRLPDIIVPGQFLKLPGGVLGMPCEVWYEWDKGFRDGPSTRLILSRDGGKSWPEAGILAKDETRTLIYGDPRLSLLPDGRLIALMWTYDFVAEKDLPVHRTESSDNGRTWRKVHNTGLTGQITSPAFLLNKVLLAVYQKRFGAEAGLRAILSYDAGLSWDHSTDTAIQGFGDRGDSTNPFAGYEQYGFGYSTVLKLSETEVLVPFWMSNGKTTCIRVLRVRIGAGRPVAAAPVPDVSHPA